MSSAGDDDVLLQLDDLTKQFKVRSGRSKEIVHAVEQVSLHVRRGETLGLVGETGCGKSTLARCAMRLHEVTAGRVLFDGEDITHSSPRRLRALRQKMQMIFQDPYGSLNPRRRVGSIIGDPFAIHNVASGQERQRRVRELMDLVGLNPEHYNRYPSEFSGGQRQRIGIARALALRPALVVCDEPVSALDVSVQAQIINLLTDLRSEFALSYLFISHDLSVVRHISDRAAVMYLGHVVEVGAVEDIFERPRHPYTSALLASVPTPDPVAADRRKRVGVTGEVPSPIRPPSGCPFHPRCPRAQTKCSVERPELELRPADPTSHAVACHFPLSDNDLVPGPGRELVADEQ
jgi:oligopeptide/dipeptide ABC transporter ATP-binding protein